MKTYKFRNYTKTFRCKKFKLLAIFGITFNNLHSGNCGFSLFLGNLFVWHQAWFGGELNEVSWWNGKFLIIIPFLDLRYSPKKGWQKND